MQPLSPRRNTAPWLPLIALLVGAFALRLVRLGADSLWYDETVSLLLAGKSPSALVAHTARDIHPPLYYLLLHWWTSLAGRTEFAAAFFSLLFGILLIPATHTVARRLLPPDSPVPILAALFVAISPYNVWYSQEVRMYTPGAFLGLLNAYAAWRLLTAQWKGQMIQTRRPAWLLFVLSAVLGLYTLYYFAFFLIFQALFLIAIVIHDRLELRPWLLAAAATILAWAAWLPIAWRQATDPPVPPWRSFTPLWVVVRDSFAALAFGQSAPAATWQPWLLLAVALYAFGLVALVTRGRRRSLLAAAYLLGTTWAPVAIIYLFSLLASPLYHVRYVFTYSPYFYIILAAGLVGLASAGPRLLRLPVVMAALLLWAGLSARSLQAFWTDPAYAADDYRTAMRHLAALWRPGDVLLVNAGYVYPAVSYYFRGPIAWQGRLTTYRPPTASESSAAGAPAGNGLVVLQSGSLEAPANLGWGSPESDFYATTTAESLAALDGVAAAHPRLWMLRAYDTVTDPAGRIRAWLHANGTLFYDEHLSGETNARLQGWLLPPTFNPHPRRLADARFGSVLQLLGVTLLTERAGGGGTLDVLVTLIAARELPADLHLALGLVDADGRQWAVADEQPVGPALPLATIAARGPLQLPLRLRVPPGLPPGKYELRLKAYTTDGPLPVRGDSAASNEQARLAVVEVATTWSEAMAEAAPMPLALTADFEGRLTLLGARVGRQAARPGETVEVELLWRAGEGLEPEEVLEPTLSLAGRATDDGGVITRYPTGSWRPGQVVRDLHRLTMNPDAAPGRYPLDLQLVAPALGKSLLASAGLDRRRSVHLDAITIEDRPRSFTAPAPSTPTDAQFGPAIELVGYDLDGQQARPGGSLQLALFWHALTRPASRYKIFTHLVDPTGQLRGQRDLEPGEGTLPTNGWTAGEYITTTLAIPIAADAPPGRYILRLGLYDPVSGARAEIFGPKAERQERYLRLFELEIGK
ncbi:MAG: glycosyltransferase family 39 protein [Ardenticatenaceae bacterium]|nr:glycosyltransferase family 39 protein [Ardenticatenaceae bacterium]